MGDPVIPAGGTDGRPSMPIIATLSGSPAVTSRTALLSTWVGNWLATRGFEVDAIDIRNIPADDLFHARMDSPVVERAMAIVARAGGLVVATPVYKAAYSGVLKAFLDLLPQLGLTGKVVLPLAVGGTLAHVLAIDYAMRPVLSSLNALHITNGLFLVDKQLERTEDGGLRIEKGIEERLEGVLHSFANSVRLVTSVRV
jgi:FMN reductase